MSDVQFVDGLMVKKPHSNAPDFVKASLSIKREDLINWLQGQSGEWINVDVKESKKGSWYAQVNDWEPAGGQNQSPAQPQSPSPSTSQDNSDIPLPDEPSMNDDDFDIGKVPF